MGREGPLRVTNYIFYILFGTEALKGTTKAPTVALMWLNILSGTKTTFLISKMYDKQHRPFYMRGPLGKCYYVEKKKKNSVTQLPDVSFSIISMKSL